MADPHVILAPIVEPPLPPLTGEAPAASVAVPLLLALAVALGVALGLWWWRRHAPQRSLRRIARRADLPQAAHALAAWQARHWPQAPAAWRETLDRLRFAVPDAGATSTLQTLCAQALQREEG